MDIRMGGLPEPNAVSHSQGGVHPKMFFTAKDRLISNSGQWEDWQQPAGLDELVARGTSARTPEAELELVKELAKMLYDDAFYIPFWIGQKFSILHDSVQDHQFYIGNYNDNRFDSVWLSEK